jgi:hypothetical protein
MGEHFLFKNDRMSAVDRGIDDYDESKHQGTGHHCLLILN